MLQNQVVSPLIYHFILLIEFLQMLFFAFYKEEFENDLNPHSEHSFKFDVDGYLAYINFHTILLQTHSKSIFLTLYICLAVLLVAFIFILIAMGRAWFESERKQEMKAGIKLAVKSMSFFMVVFLFLFQIPLLTIFFSGFICSSGSAIQEYEIELECYSPLHIILICCSCFLVPIYLLFMTFQSMAYTSNNFESNLPWSSLERRLVLVRLALKVWLTGTFVFDKRGRFLA